MERNTVEKRACLGRWELTVLKRHTEEAVQIREMKKIQERRAFQAKQTASAKALWQRCA